MSQMTLKAEITTRPFVNYLIVRWFSMPAYRQRADREEPQCSQLHSGIERAYLVRDRSTP